MEVPQSSVSRIGLIEKLAGYQELLQAEKDHVQRSLNFIAKYQIGGKIPETELDIQQSIEAFAEIYKCVDFQTPSSKKQMVVILLEILQSDLILTTYVDKFIGDLLTTLGNTKIQIDDKILQTHLLEFSKNIARHNQMTSNELTRIILGLSGTEALIAYESTQYDLPRTHYLNDEIWADIDSAKQLFPELEHQKLNLYLYSQLENDLNAMIGETYYAPNVYIPTKEVTTILGGGMMSFCDSKNQIFRDIFKDELLAPFGSVSKTTTTAARLRGKLFVTKTFADYILTSQEVDDFLNKSYRSLSSKLATPVVEQKKGKAAKKKKQLSKKQIIITPKLVTDVVPQPKEEVKASLKLDLIPSAVEIIELAPVVFSPEQEIEEEWDYYKWLSEQSFTNKQTATTCSTPSKQVKTLTLPELSDLGQEFYNAVFGLGGKNITIKHFSSFLKDIGGFKMKMTKNGLKKVDLSDPSVEIFYSVPNLGISKNGTGYLIYKLHQPHAGDEFARRTLYEFLRPQLEAAGIRRDKSWGA